MEEDLKILEEFMHNCMQRDKLERDDRCGGWKIGDIYKHLELNPAIDHLIQVYKEQQAELEGLKNINNNQSKDIQKAVDYTFELNKELEKKDKIINDAIIAVENLRQYFSEDLQPDFIGILEILKDKKVIDW